MLFFLVIHFVFQSSRMPSVISYLSFPVSLRHAAEADILGDVRGSSPVYLNLANSRSLLAGEVS